MPNTAIAIECLVYSRHVVKDEVSKYMSLFFETLLVKKYFRIYELIDFIVNEKSPCNRKILHGDFSGYEV